MCIITSELNQRVEELRRLKVLKEETENAIKSLERDVIYFMAEMKLTEYIGTDFKTTYKPQSRTTIDKERLESDLGSLTDYEKVTSYNVLRIK